MGLQVVESVFELPDIVTVVEIGTIEEGSHGTFTFCPTSNNEEEKNLASWDELIDYIYKTYELISGVPDIRVRDPEYELYEACVNWFIQCWDFHSVEESCTVTKFTMYNCMYLEICTIASEVTCKLTGFGIVTTKVIKKFSEFQEFVLYQVPR
jgi:hypothetical protein